MTSSSTAVKKGQPLAPYSTYGIGGPAKAFIEAKTTSDVIDGVKWAADNQMAYLVIGKGSNCLFDDRGFNGLVILNKINHMTHTDDLAEVGAGYSFSLLGVKTARAGWSGLEFASGIPGSVGGAVAMNAGANGQETCDVLAQVQVVDGQGELRTYQRSELAYAYRSSPFLTNGEIVVGASFNLTPSSEARTRQIEIVNRRMETQPLADKSAGCIFRNPPDMSAGQLIDACGLKGSAVGDAVVSEKHANFLINKGSATATDLRHLIDKVVDSVRQQTGIELASEVRYVPYET